MHLLDIQLCLEDEFESDVDKDIEIDNLFCGQTMEKVWRSL